jgi:hypothetical protein
MYEEKLERLTREDLVIKSGGQYCIFLIERNL